MIFTHRATNQDSNWDRDEVHVFLLRRGFFIGPQGANPEPDRDDPSTIVVRVDLDANVPQEALDAALDEFVPSVDPARIAQVAMRKAYAEIKAANGKTVEDRLAACERAILAFGVTIGVGP